MRFIQCNNENEFILSKDYVDHIPKYAILSHKWGEDSEEVTLRDLKDRSGKSKAGYNKIRFCGEQAMRDGLRYFWLDTCCIDQSNSTEVQEAINSMFRWYKNADKCYVYLSDVTTKKRKVGDLLSDYTWESQFRASRWFTRGWTLQELIAPPNVEFFSREGSRLGDKISLERQVHDITGIAVSALRGAPLSQFGVDEKFSWAKPRETKKTEDTVYSLLGIFDVSMTPRYGEGREKAFMRLKKKIDNYLNVELGHKKRVMNWLSDTPYEKHHHHNSQRRSEGSGEWLLKTTKFKEWRTRPESEILWLRGSPGAGKTLLTSRVVDSFLQEKETTQSPTPVAYFYCSRASDDTKRGDPTNVLRSIAKQLAQPGESVPLADPVDRRYKEIVDSDQERDLDISETIGLIVELKDINSAVIIIDGLDESSSQDGKRGALFQGLKTIASSPGKVVKIFVASRDEFDIMGAFSDYPYHWIDAQDNEADIRKYVEEQLEKAIQHRSKTSGRRISARLEVKIRKKLTDEAGGIFRWVGLQLQSLFDTNVNKLEGDMEHQLSKLPKDLEESYNVIYRQLLAQGSSSQIIAHKAIAWLLCARQPISTLEFIRALNVGFNHPEINTKEEVIDICRNFIKHDEDLDRFRIFHLSVTNYFEDQRRDWPKNLLNRVVADICLEQCLSQHTWQQYQIPNRENKTFGDYANVYWPYHYSLAGADQKLGILKVPLEDKLRSFLLGGQSTSREFSRWRQQCYASIRSMDLDAKDIDSKQLTTKLQDSLDEWSPDPPSRTFVACAFGFSEIVKDMLDNGEDFTVRTEGSRLQPLYVAIRHEHNIVEEVIRARIPDNHSTYIRSMEINAVVRTGKDKFVKWLLNRHPDNLITYGILHGAAENCNARTFGLLQNCATGSMTQCDFWKEDLLVAAAHNKENGERIVKLLLPELQTCNEEAYTAAASNENHGLSVLRCLFNKFKPTIIDHQMIETAASNHQTGKAILQQILIQFPDWKPDEEVIISSATRANFRTFKILLDAFSPVHITQEVLIAAARNEKSGLELVELLLTYKFEVADPDEVMVAAAGNQRCGLELVKLLLTYEFKVSNLDNVVIAAIGNSKFGSEIVKELLERFRGVTSLVIEKAASMSSPDLRVLQKLLSLPDNLALNDAIIENAAMNNSSGSELIALFLEVRQDDLTTKRNLLAEALTSNYTIKPTILEHALHVAQNPSLVWDALWNAVEFPNEEVLSVFLDFIDAPEELSWLVEIIAANEYCGVKMIEMIFTKIPSLCITPEAIEIASENQAWGDKIVEYLLGRDSEVAVSIDAILAATKNRDKGKLVMHLLLPRFPGVVPLTEETVIACASNLAHAHDLMEMLLDQNGTDWSEKAALTTLFCEALVHRGNFRCLKSFLGKVKDLCIRMTLYEFGPSPRIDTDLVEKLLEFCDDDLINYDLIYRVVSGAYNVDDLSFVQKLLSRLEPSTFAENSLYHLAARRQEGAAQMLRLLQTEGFNTVIEKETVLAAVRSSSVGVLVELGFAKWGLEYDEEVLETAARNPSQGLRMLRLLSRQWNAFQITESVLTVAAKNYSQAAQVLQFLWRQDPSLQITEAIIIAAAQNEGQGVQALQFLWTHDPSLQITEDILVAAAQNDGQAVRVLQFLWTQNTSLQVTEDILVAASQNCSQAVPTLQFLLKQDPSLQISEAILIATAQNEDQAVQVLQFLWRQDPSLQITEAIIIAAAQNEDQGLQALQSLWRQDPSLQITEAILITAAQNEGQVVKVLQFLWRQDSSLQITEAIVVAAAQNEDQAVQALQFLWRQDPSLQVTEAIFIAASQNRSQAVPTLQFLWRQDPSLKIIEAILIAAAQNRSQVVQVLQFLWRQDPSLQITEAVLIAAAQNENQVVPALQFLWRQDPSLQVTEDILVAAAQNGGQAVRALQYLWTQKGALQVTEDILVAASQNRGQAVRALQLLWRQDPSLQITEAILIAAAQNVGYAVQALQFLWRQDPSLQVTEDILVAAAQNGGQAVRALQYLWTQKGALQVTEDILVAASQNRGQAVRVLQFLWRQDATIQVTEPLLIAAARNSDQAVQALRFLWMQDTTLQVEEPVLAASTQSLQALQFLWRQKTDLQITEDILVAAAKNGDEAVRVLEFLWRQDPSLRLTEAMVVAAAQNGDEAVLVLQFLWRQDPSLQITEAILIAATQNEDQAVLVLQFLWKNCPSLQITVAMLVAAVQNLLQAVLIFKFFGSQLNQIEITDQLLDISNNNWDYDLEILKKHWKKRFGIFTPRVVFSQLRLQKQKRKQIFNFLREKQRCQQGTISIG